MRRFLFIVVTFFIWWLFRRSHRNKKISDEKQAALTGQLMRACAQCGVHVPENEGVFDNKDNVFFCSADHQKAAHQSHHG